MNRRHAPQTTAAALSGIPMQRALALAPELPEAALHARDAEKYWARIRKEQFLLPEWRAFLNNGSLGVAPRPVVDAMTAQPCRRAGDQRLPPLRL